MRDDDEFGPPRQNWESVNETVRDGLLVFSAIAVVLVAILVPLQMRTLTESVDSVSTKTDTSRTEIVATNALLQNIYSEVQTFSETAGPLSVFKFGLVQDVDSGTTPEDVIYQGGLQPFPTTAQTVSVASGSGNDVNGTGSGAWDLTIVGLNSSYDEVMETVYLNGTTAVNTTTAYIRVYRAYVNHGGATKLNEGLLTLTYVEDATVAAVIGIGYGQTTMAVYTVPRGFTFNMVAVSAALARSGTLSSTSVTVNIYRCAFDVNTACRLITSLVATGAGSSRVTDQFFSPISIAEKTDIFARVVEVTANDVTMTAKFSGTLVPI